MKTLLSNPCSWTGMKKYASLLAKDFFCWLFHPPLKRVGTRRVHKHSIAYDMVCPRCGRETVKMIWI